MATRDDTVTTNAADGRTCHADLTQRKHCRHYHEKTGRCTNAGVEGSADGERPRGDGGDSKGD